MHVNNFVKERVGAVRPEAGGKREPPYRTAELNGPNPFLLLRLIEMLEEETSDVGEEVRKDAVIAHTDSLNHQFLAGPPPKAGPTGRSGRGRLNFRRGNGG